jgi:intein/homing endonuclease
MKQRGKILFLVLALAFILISLSNFSQAGTLKVTEEHPFLINGSWIPASDLKVGDELTTIDGKKVRITNITDVETKEPFPVYNLEAGKYHDFVVDGGDGVGVVVHNSNNEEFCKLFSFEQAKDQHGSNLGPWENYKFYLREVFVTDDVVSKFKVELFALTPVTLNEDDIADYISETFNTKTFSFNSLDLSGNSVYDTLQLLTESQRNSFYNSISIYIKNQVILREDYIKDALIRGLAGGRTSTTFEMPVIISENVGGEIVEKKEIKITTAKKMILSIEQIEKFSKLLAINSLPIPINEFEIVKNARPVFKLEMWDFLGLCVGGTCGTDTPAVPFYKKKPELADIRISLVPSSIGLDVFPHEFGHNLHFRSQEITRLAKSVYRKTIAHQLGYKFPSLYATKKPEELLAEGYNAALGFINTPNGYIFVGEKHGRKFLYETNPELYKLIERLRNNPSLSAYFIREYAPNFHSPEKLLC